MKREKEQRSPLKTAAGLLKACTVIGIIGIIGKSLGGFQRRELDQRD